MTDVRDPFAGKEVSDADYVTWDKPGTQITGVLRNIRQGTSRDGKVVHYLDLYVGNDRTVSCSAPSILYSKVVGVPKPIGRAFRIQYTHAEKSAGGTLKRFIVSALDVGADLRSIDKAFWGVEIPAPGTYEGPASITAAPGQPEGEGLPF